MSEQHSILLMDEDAETLEQLQTALQRKGYHVLVAADGQAALRLIQSAQPSLIVSDLLLAGIDGYEVWEKIRTNKEIPKIPILVTSALEVPPSHQPWRPTANSEWQRLRYDAYLPKPVDLQRFIRIVARLLEPDDTQTIPTGPSIVLAIEDQKLRDHLAEILQSQNFGVDILDSLARVKKVVEAYSPTTLIMDYRTPHKKIRSILFQIHKSMPETAKILLVSSQTEIDDELKEICDGFLHVPFHPLYTVESVNNILELTNSRRRTEILSRKLIATNRNWLDILHEHQAQKKELEYVNSHLRELDSLKSTFTSMVVHDLKSPLGSMLGALNFLLTDPDLALSDVNESLLIGALAAGNQMLRLVETLLEGQRLEEGKIKPDHEPFDLATIVDICVQQVIPLLTLHHLEVETFISDDLSLIYADPHICQRILENLLDNAIKFSPAGSTITIKAIILDNTFSQISVADIGPGIPEEQQEKIFDRFTQLKKSSSNARSGFGLGLAFCHLATHAMDGKIWVESDGESGTTFVFTLPQFNDDE